MTDQKPTLRARLTKLRTDPRVAAFSLLGPSGQVFDLVDAIIGEIDAQAERLARIELALGFAGVPDVDMFSLVKRVAAIEARTNLPTAALTTEHPLRGR